MGLQDSSGCGAAALRKFLFAILVLGLAASGLELWLTGHTEDFWQLVPLVLIAAALAALLWQAASAGRPSLLVLRALMVLFIASGFAGTALHARARMEFKKESSPALAGFELFRESLRTHSPPALAPGFMIQLGLLGLAYAWRHPALERPARKP